jgi:hypothetical protein
MLEKWHFHVISDLIRILVDFRQGDLSLSYGGDGWGEFFSRTGIFCLIISDVGSFIQRGSSLTSFF